MTPNPLLGYLLFYLLRMWCVWVSWRCGQRLQRRPFSWDTVMRLSDACDSAVQCSSSETQIIEYSTADELITTDWSCYVGRSICRPVKSRGILSLSRARERRRLSREIWREARIIDNSSSDVSLRMLGSAWRHTDNGADGYFRRCTRASRVAARVTWDFVALASQRTLGRRVERQTSVDKLRDDLNHSNLQLLNSEILLFHTV